VECLFCKIVKGEIPSKKIYENHGALAFLDISPLSDGHVLVVPKKHFVQAHEMDAASWEAVADALNQVSKRLTDCLGVEDYNILQNNGKLAHQVVMHVHFHVIPKFPGAGLKLQWDSRPSNIDEVHKKLTGKQRTLDEVV
jgi:histidine triad (HIT) family protein